MRSPSQRRDRCSLHTHGRRRQPPRSLQCGPRLESGDGKSSVRGHLPYVKKSSGLRIFSHRPSPLRCELKVEDLKDSDEGGPEDSDKDVEMVDLEDSEDVPYVVGYSPRTRLHVPRISSPLKHELKVEDSTRFDTSALYVFSALHFQRLASSALCSFSVLHLQRCACENCPSATISPG